MKITRELLERYDSCQDGLNWLQANYPEGEELLTILTSDPLPPPDFIVWGIKYFDVSDEEKAAANRILNNINSERVFGSWDVSDSNFVVDSQKVSNSLHIISSQNISNSSDIHDSSDIVDSHHVINTKDAISAEYTYDSESVQCSSYIYSSQSISWSQFIKNSLNIEDGIYCSLCKVSNLLTICEAVENSSNCCLCFGLKNKNNYLFNKPSTYERVEEVRTAIMNLLNLNELDPKVLKSATLSNFFDTIPASVKNYIKSLPEYEEVLGASFNVSI